jgi:hypothetical protein
VVVVVDVVVDVDVDVVVVVPDPPELDLAMSVVAALDDEARTRSQWPPKALTPRPWDWRGPLSPAKV